MAAANRGFWARNRSLAMFGATAYLMAAPAFGHWTGTRETLDHMAQSTDQPPAVVVPADPLDVTLVPEPSPSPDEETGPTDDTAPAPAADAPPSDGVAPSPDTPAPAEDPVAPAVPPADDADAAQAPSPAPASPAPERHVALPVLGVDEADGDAHDGPDPEGDDAAPPVAPRADGADAPNALELATVPADVLGPEHDDECTPPGDEDATPMVVAFPADDGADGETPRDPEACGTPSNDGEVEEPTSAIG